MKLLLSLLLGLGVVSTACKSNGTDTADVRAETVTLAVTGMT